ncbi:kinase-like protein [Hesseltinella vesiculosa]|uniref:Kinase-like protein n=1 Tax=Hesseltinella vesiculosa TaxID=101127 RepID=A0A1X2GP13_9FUNG|nr:kinase-like protein [Hesseltinella vesiculosa]
MTSHPHVSFSTPAGLHEAYDDDDLAPRKRLDTDLDPAILPQNDSYINSVYAATNYASYDRTIDPYSGLGSTHNEIIDQSGLPDSEKVIELSPDERYVRLNTLLGKGAYKVVYKAIDREEGYEVAWNSVQTMRTPSNKELDHEIQILKSVRHPNIIAFHDAWHNDNEFVFVTELMTSGTLREYIRKLKPLPNLKIVKRWSRQILKGLVYLHGHNPPIIHRDIKCDNIFINGAHGEVKIGDMGTAEMKLGKKYTLIGTPEFMAPEMYEEQGYNEKVDVYAFGMCLLEMATGEYPYAECTNPAQIYKKVSAGIKPACLGNVTHPEMLSIINNCLGPEDERMSAEKILEHSLFAVEPDVILMLSDPNHVHLTMQVVFKGMDKLSVKFDFNVDTDTAEQVVREMIEEQVLPERYQQHITKEINRILRDTDKPDEPVDDKPSVWRRENDIRSELDRTRLELQQTTEHVLDMEAKVEDYEARARNAEAKYQEAMHRLREKQQLFQSLDEMVSHPHSESAVASSNTSSPANTLPVLPSSSTTVEHRLTPDSNGYASDGSHPPHEPPSNALVSHLVDEYGDDTDIDVFVRDCALAAHRSQEKAQEWSKKLQNQDIMTVGDLRDLHDEDWAGIGLTVFALRALKNMLKGKRLLAGQPLLPSTGTAHSSPATSAYLSPSPPPQ